MSQARASDDCRPRWMDGLRAAEAVFQRLVLSADEANNAEAARTGRETLAEIRAKLARAAAPP